MILKIYENKAKIGLLIVFTLTGILTPLPFISLSDDNSQTKQELTPKTAQTLIAIALPDDDLDSPWSTPLNHYDKLDECESESDPIDGSVITANANDNDEIERFSISNPVESPCLVSQITIHTNGRSFGTTNPKVSIKWNGEWTAWQGVGIPISMPGPLAYGWAQNIFTVSGPQAQLNNLEVRYQASCNGWMWTPFGTINIGSNTVGAFFCEVAYEFVTEITEHCRPVNDGELNEWSYYPLPHYSRINEDVINPQSGDSIGIFARDMDGDSNKIEEFEMDNNIKLVKEVKKIEVQTFGMSFGTSNPKVRIWWDGAWTAWQGVGIPISMPGPLTPGWATNTWNLEGDQFDVNDLRVQYLSQCSGWIWGPYGNMAIGINLIYTSYCDITYEPVDEFIPIGGLDRAFAQEPVTRLGYTFYTISALEPKIQFKITEVGSDADVTINLYGDMDPINPDPDPFWSQTLNVDETFESEPIDVAFLTEYLTHTIVIEIVSSGNSNYTLDYLEIQNCYFTESLAYENDKIDPFIEGGGIDLYSPSQIYQYGEEYNNVMVMFGSNIPFESKDLIGVGINEIGFKPSLVFQMDHEYEVNDPVGCVWEWYYLYSMNIQMKVINENGDFLTTELRESISIEMDDEDNGEINEIFDFIFALFTDLVGLGLSFAPPYITIPVDIIFLLTTIFDFISSDTEPTIAEEFIQDDEYEISWRTGYSYGNPNGGKVYTTPPVGSSRTDARFQGDWDMYYTLVGDYQIQFTWNVCVKRRAYLIVLGYPHHSDMPAYEINLSGEHYINCVKG